MSQDELAMALYEAIKKHCQHGLMGPPTDLSSVDFDGTLDLLLIADEIMQAAAKSDAARRKA